MLSLLPNRTVPVSAQCRLYGTTLLVSARAGLAITIVPMDQQPPPGIEVEAEGRLHVSLVIVSACCLSGLPGIVPSRISWQRSSEVLQSAQAATAQTVECCSRVWAAILIVIGVGMMGAVMERSFMDFAVGTAVLANFGSATVASAEQVRHLEHLRRVRYYCLAISPGSWRMVWTRQ